jgi:hypothetical protein
MAIPLLMLPLGELIADWTRKESKRTLWLFFLVTLACVFEQIYFSLGEVFSFLHIVKWDLLSHGINVLADDALYLDWAYSPLLYLLDAKRGPFLLKYVHMSNGNLFWLCAALAGVILFLEYVRMFKKYLGRRH